MSKVKESLHFKKWLKLIVKINQFQISFYRFSEIKDKSDFTKLYFYLKSEILKK